jgi:Protein of unknown function (DUF3306)
MSAADGFLARWSRRKQEARREEPVDQLDPTPAEPDAPLGAEPEEPPPELPPVESITADTDISVFLAKGVADSVRNAALRRMWSLDPAIRDYVGDARDYAYDWNTPGGVPGFGAIEPSYDVEGTIARMFSGPQEPKGEDALPQDEKPLESVADGDPPTSDEGTALAEPGPQIPMLDETVSSADSTPAPESPTRVNTPRHGRATPV